MTANKPANVTVARVVRPHGRRGEVACEILTDFPERLTHLDEVREYNNFLSGCSLSSTDVLNIGHLPATKWAIIDSRLRWHKLSELRIEVLRTGSTYT